MRFVDLFTMSVNNLRRRTLRTALTVLGVVVGTASIVVMLSLGIGLKELNQELIESSMSLTSIQVQSDSYWGGNEKNPNYLTDEKVKVIKQMDYIDSVYPVLECNVLAKQGRYSAPLTLKGMPREYLEQIPLGQGTIPSSSEKEMKLIYGNAVLMWFSDEKRNSAFWDTGKLPNVDLMGRSVFVVFDTDAYYQAMSGDHSVKMPKKYLIPTAGVVKGDVQEYNPYSFDVYADMDLLKAQLRRIFKRNPIPGQPTNKKGKPYRYFIYSSCIVNVDRIEHVTEVQQKLTDMGYRAYSNVEWMEQSAKQSKMIQAVLGGIGAISLFVAAIGITNTMMMSIYERTKEIGVIKVLGCDMGTIRNMFLLESGFIGFMGGIIGLIFSYGISFLFNHFLSVDQMGQMMSMMGGGMEGDISRIPIWLSVSAVGFAILIGMVAGLFPALRAMKLSPLAAIRNE